MNIEQGLQLKDPEIFVPWFSTPEEIKTIFQSDALKEVTRNYHTLRCEPLPGLNCVLGFHTRMSGRLTELEFFRESYPDQPVSFAEFQQYFEATFGKPNSTKHGSEGFPEYEWRFGKIRIIHYIFDRFGLEEHMRIQHL